MSQINDISITSSGAASSGRSVAGAMDTESIRADFPILRRKIEDKPLIYFDNAATSLKPRPVIEAVLRYYTESTANIHRGVHQLSGEASELFEEARRKVAYFINADEEEVVFVRNATEGVNLLRNSLPINGAVVTTLADHHSNMLPWMGSNKGFRHIGVERDGSIDLDRFKKELTSDVALVCIPHISNALGVISPIRELIDMAHAVGALVMVDGSQSVPHVPTDVQDLDCDFLVFSGHKMLAPSGTGVLFGRRELLEKMDPFLLGGDMNKEVHKDRYVVADLPTKFEAGTPHIEGAIGLGAAVDYLENIGMENVRAHCRELTGLALEELSKIEKIKIFGPLDPERRSASVAFELPGLEAHGLAKMLSLRYAIMVRSGFHCAQPLHEALSIPPSVRASFYLYNTPDEVITFAAAVAELSEMYTKSMEGGRNVYIKSRT